MIDADLARFLEGGLAIHIATRDANLEPDGTRIPAVKVDDGGACLTVYVPKVSEARVLPNLLDNGQAAVCFVRPIDERACQIKGTFLSAREASDAEHAFAAAQWEGFGQNLERIGLPRALTEGWTMQPCLAVRLRVTALFSQTPGPKAGASLA
jgi:hypothetical protein